MNKRIVYIAHPIGGDVEENLKDLARILRIINTNSHPKNPAYLDKLVDEWNNNTNSTQSLSDFLKLSKGEYKAWIKDQFIIYDFSDVIPLAPYYADIISLDDNVQEERARGIENDIALIKTGVFKEMWLTGNKVSFGMNEEIKLFQSLNTPIFNYVGKF